MKQSLNIKTLNAIAARLSDRADELTQITVRGLADDLRLASRIATKLALVRRRLADIGPATTDPAIHDGIAALLRELENGS
jgi:hypothetical protein